MKQPRASSQWKVPLWVPTRFFAFIASAAMENARRDNARHGEALLLLRVMLKGRSLLLHDLANNIDPFPPPSPANKTGPPPIL